MTTRYIVDHLNHLDLIGPGGGGVPEAPRDGVAFGRRDGGWDPVLRLAGGQLQGSLLTAGGTRNAPGLMIGTNDSGFYRNGTIVYLTCSYGEVMAWTPNMIVCWAPINLGNLSKIEGLADATTAGDAVNMRTGDARYGRGAWVDFVVDSGWTSSTLRQRLVDGGASLQFEGQVSGPLPANARAQIGVLPVDMRPTRLQRFAGVVTVGIGTLGIGMVEVATSGIVQTLWTIGTADTPSTLGFSVTFGLD